MNSTDKNGFTLIELIIAISLITLALFLVSLKIQLENIILKGEANNIVSALRYTRQLSINGEFKQRFVLFSKDGKICYRIAQDEAFGKVYLIKTIDPSVIVQSSAAADLDDDGISSSIKYTKLNKDINKEFNVIKFKKNSATGCSIILEGLRSSKIYKITIVPTSGRIYLYEIDRK